MFCTKVEYRSYHRRGDFKKMYLQQIITQYFISNRSEIWSLPLIVHSKG